MNRITQTVAIKEKLHFNKGANSTHRDWQISHRLSVPNHRGSGTLGDFQIGQPNRLCRLPPTQVFVTSEKNHKHLVASSSKNLSINSVSPRSLLLTRLNRPHSLRPHSGHIASSYSCENFLLR